MFKLKLNVFYILIALGFVNASIFDDLEDAKHAAKFNFINGINSSPELNSALDLPHDKVFSSIDNLIKKELADKFGDAIHDIVEQLKDVGYETMATVNQIKQLVNQIYENLKSLSTQSKDILTKESESQEQNTNKVQEFFQFLRIGIVGYNKLEFENIYGFQNIVKPIKDKAYNVTQQIKDKLEELDERIGQLRYYLMLINNSSEKQIQFQKVLAKFKDEFIDNLDVKAVTKTVNELNDANHPLVEVIEETVKDREAIVNKTIECSVDNIYYTSGPDPKKSACDLKDMISECEKIGCDKCCEKSGCDKCNDNIKKYINTNVTLNYKNKFDLAFTSGGLHGLNHTVVPICGSHSYFMAVVIYELTGTLFIVQNQLYYQLQERIFLFIDWLKLVIHNGFNFSDSKLTNLQISAQKIMTDLKEHNKKELTDALKLFKPFQKEFQGIFDDIQKELMKAIKYS